jgi:hypothetical protein
MARFILSLLLLCSIALLLTNSLGHGQGKEVLTGTVISQLLAQLDTVVSNALDKADYLVAKTGIEARLAIQSWRDSNLDLLDKAFTGLTDQQQQFFRNIDNSLEQLSRLEKTTANDVERTTESGSQIVADLRFWDGKPAITRSNPIVVHPSVSQDFVLTLRGINLLDADPQVVFQEGQLERVGLERQEARFRVPSSLFDFDEKKMSLKKGRITLKGPQGFWARLARSARPESGLDFSFILLPEQLGTVKVISSRKVTEQLYKPPLNIGPNVREFHFSSGSIDWECQSAWQRPSEGYLIATNSVGVEVRSGKRLGRGLLKNLCVPAGGVGAECQLPGEWGKAGRWRMLDNTPLGFAVEVCAKRYFHGVLGTKTGPGYKHVRIAWREHQKAEKLVPNEAVELPIGWRNPIHRKLNEQTSEVYIEVRLFNGLARGELGGWSSEFVKVTWDRNTKQLVIQPLVPDSLTGL